MTGERLLTLRELLDVLHLGRSTFYKHEATLKARGLQCVGVGSKRLFRRASVDGMIARAAERGEPLC